MEAVTSFLDDVAAFDAVLLALIVFSCGFGMVQGFTAMIFTKISILAGILLAFFNGAVVAKLLVQAGVPQSTAGFLAPALIVFLAGLIGWLTASSVVKFLKLLKLGFINNLLGGGYGFLRVAALILTGTAATAHLGALDKDFYDASRIMHASGWTLYQIKEAQSAPDPIKDFLNSFSYDSENYRPQLKSAAEAGRTRSRPGRRKNRQQPQETMSQSEATAIKMLERSIILKETSDAVADREQEAQPEPESRLQRLRRLRKLKNRSGEEILAEEMEKLRNMDEDLLEDLMAEDEKISEYLEDFKQQEPNPEKLQPEN